MLGPREQRLVAAGWRGRLCTDEGDVIIFLEPGEGASRGGALSLLEREGGDRRTSLDGRSPSAESRERRTGWTEMPESLKV